MTDNEVYVWVGVRFEILQTRQWIFID